MTDIRPVVATDVPALIGLIGELALFEGAPAEIQLTEQQLYDVLFGDEPTLFGHVADIDDEVVGCALWFLNFSTWRGTRGVYLEDLFVRDAYRGQGLGRALLVELARVCRANGYARMEWSVLDWNAPAIRLYESVGALPQTEWSTYRLTDEALSALADG